jgi:N-acyl-D-aspartate/D-glutamate deacylase
MKKLLLTILAGCIIIVSNAQFIQNVKIIDGSGKPAFEGAVRVVNGKIAAIGNIQATKGEQVLDGKGMVLAPGFIDAHSHHFGSLYSNPTGIPVTSQGVTTIVSGQDGESDPVDSIAAFINRTPIAINVATFTGHSALREQVMGEKDVYRTATPSEIESMKKLLIADMDKGSLGLSTGLEYEQAFFSSKQEVIDLAKVAGIKGGRYISHIRSEDITLEDAVDEIINIGREAKLPVQLTHMKISMVSKWNSSNAMLAKLEKARVEGINITADVYPYNFWNSTLRVLFPRRDYTNIESARFAVKETFNPKESYLVQYAPMPEYKGKTIYAISQLRNEPIENTLMNLIQIASDYKAAHPDFKGSLEAIAAKGMNDPDVANFMKWKYSGICSDGSVGGHPRGFGAFPRILAKYVRTEKLLTLEEAVYKMTNLNAQNLGIKNKGLIKVGYDADLVLFDPLTVQDNATIEQPHALATGIEKVWVNGELVYEHLQPTAARPGKLIKRK